MKEKVKVSIKPDEKIIELQLEESMIDDIEFIEM